MEEDPLKSLTAVVSLEELLAARAEAAKIFCSSCIREYMVQIAEATRRADGILAGVSPRGTLGLLRCVKAYAYLQGRSYVIPDDVRTLLFRCWPTDWYAASVPIPAQQQAEWKTSFPPFLFPQKGLSHDTTAGNHCLCPASVSGAEICIRENMVSGI